MKPTPHPEVIARSLERLNPMSEWIDVLDASDDVFVEARPRRRRPFLDRVAMFVALLRWNDDVMEVWRLTRWELE